MWLLIFSSVFHCEFVVAGRLAGSPPLRVADREQPQARDCQDTIQQGQPHHANDKNGL